MTDADQVARAFRDRRMGLQLSMRDIQSLSLGLANQNPELYEGLGRNVVSEVEKFGLSRLRNMSSRAARALITLVFGTLESFTLDTGIDLHLSSAAHGQEHQIPLYNTGDLVVPHELPNLDNGPSITSPVVTARYALRVQQNDLAPMIYPSQVVFVSPTVTPTVGALMVLHRNGRLALAYAVPGDRFATPQGKSAFALGRSDAVIGRVISAEPCVPESLLTASAPLQNAS